MSSSDHARLEEWQWRADGLSLEGLVYGKPGFKDGTPMTTSEVPEAQRFADHVVTSSGSTYMLGAPRGEPPSTADTYLPAPALGESEHPRLEGWQWRADGSLEGFVYGKPGYREGEPMTTSEVPEAQRFAGHVVTASGSTYVLGAPRGAPST